MKIKDHVESIIVDYNKGLTIRAIAIKYEVLEKTIHNLLTGRSYGGKYKVKEVDNRKAGYPVKLTFGTGREHIIPSVRTLAKFLGLEECTVTNILQGREKFYTIEKMEYV